MFEHPPTVTLGIRSRPSSVLLTPGELARRGVTLHRADRGGDAAWHGPGQLVGYPIVRPAALGFSVPGYVRAVEEALKRWVSGLGGEARIDPGRPGLWDGGGSKVASVGVRLRGGVSAHGFALNLHGPLPGCEAVVPCGLPGISYTTVQALTGRVVTPGDAALGVAVEVGKVLGFGKTEFHDLSA
jgi:lipoyl(octanoyl) transferase